LAVLRLGGRIVPLEARDVAEVDEIRRRGLSAAVAPVRRQRRLECAARSHQVSQLLSDEAQVVLIGGHAASVPGSLAQRAGARVEISRPSQVAAVLAYAAQCPDRVACRAIVAYALGQLTRPVEVDLGAVVLLREVESSADVA